MELEFSKLRELPYDELKSLHDPVIKELRADSGNEYRVELLAVWDDRPNGNLRVVLGVAPWWGWGIATPKELTMNFIMAPDGSFVGENDS